MKDTQVIQVQFFGSGSSVPVEQHSKPMCARGSIPLPTTKNFKKRFVCLSKLTYLCNETGQRNVYHRWFPILTSPKFFSAL